MLISFFLGLAVGIFIMAVVHHHAQQPAPEKKPPVKVVPVSARDRGRA